MVFPVVVSGCDSWTVRKAEHWRIDALNCAGEDSWDSLGLQEDQTNTCQRKSTNIHWKDWCSSWSSNNLATWCEELTHWERPWCWERLRARGEGGNREWDGLMLLTQWTLIWANPQRQRRTGNPGILQSIRKSWAGLSDWATAVGNVERWSLGNVNLGTGSLVKDLYIWT